MGNSDAKENERCLASDVFASSLGLENWMSNNAERLKDKKLIEVRLPGTHHSGSFSITTLGWQFSVCQNTRIEPQLRGGVRFLDLRYGDYTGISGYRVCHGQPCQYGRHF